MKYYTIKAKDRNDWSFAPGRYATRRDALKAKRSMGGKVGYFTVKIGKRL